jgi:hypothetical protein
MALHLDHVKLPTTTIQGFFFIPLLLFKKNIILNDYIQAIFHSIMLLDSLIQNNNIQDSFPSSLLRISTHVK